MIRFLNTLMCTALVCLLLITLGLYATANADILFPPTAVSEETEPERQIVVVTPSEQPVTPIVVTAAPGAAGAEKLVSFEGIDLKPFEMEVLLLDVNGESEQAIVLLANATEGNIWLVERIGGRWYCAAGPLYCRIGANGLTATKGDGDGKTPIGVTEVGAAYSEEQLAFEWPVIEMTGGDVWGTDIQSDYYNRYAGPGEAESAGGSAKELTGSDGAKWYIDIGHNAARIPGLGAGVLLHNSDNLKTPVKDGGIAVSSGDMLRILEWLDPDRRPVMRIANAGDASWTLESAMPSDFVFVDDAVPDILVDARYAGDDNFIGRPIDGYLGNRVVVTKEIAQALCTVQAYLAKQGLGLVIYDGYRPQRAVDDIFRWLADPEDTTMRQQYYPHIDKSKLTGIYLAQNSRHTRGMSVDVSLYWLDTGETLDMGTEFDFFSERSWLSAPDLTAEQSQNRALLHTAMTVGRFSGYDKEWWHFNYDGGRTRYTAYDFVIPQ